MSLLLDTHALLWWLADAPLEPSAAERVADPDTAVFVSAASLWEISIKRAKGKLEVEESISEHAAESGFEALAITWDHAELAGSLPRHHPDPFDRMLVSQARIEGLTLVTRDGAFDAYDVPTIRC